MAKANITVMLLKKYFIFILLLIISGCSIIEQSHTPVQWKTHQQQLDTIHSYAISGKLGYISPEERQSLNLYLRKREEKTELRLSSFMGQTVLKMTLSPRFAIIDTYDNQHIVTVTPQKTLFQLTGLHIPVEHLEQWLLGYPTENANFTLNDTNTLATLDSDINHATWQVKYQSYQTVKYQKGELPLPYKLSLKQAKTKLNLVISKWKIEP